VVDLNEGFEEQTLECIDLIKTFKTPFLIAANKLDLIPGWKSSIEGIFIENMKKQDEFVRRELEGKVYTMMGSLSRLGLRGDLYNKVSDFTKTIAIVPVSAKTGEGISELLSILIGLTQQYMGERLAVTEGPARGSVIEVTEETGLGTTVNVIIYDGTLKQGDSIILGGRDEIITTKIRALLLPKPLDEMKDPRDKFTSVNEVTAAAGVKLAAPNLEGALAGSPLYATLNEKDTEEYRKQVADEIGRLRISTDKIGIVLKTDTLGSLEAITAELKKSDVSIRLADVGDISRRDVIEAESVRQRDEIHGVILGFNVKLLSDAKEEAQNKAIKIFQQNIIYHLIDDYLVWIKEERTRKIEEAFEDLVLPCKIKILPGYVFRRSRPAIVGVEILGGRLRTRVRLVDLKGREVGQVSQIQDRGESLTEATAGMQVAVSLRGPIVGRHIHEGDLLYTQIPEEHARVLLRRFEQELDPREVETLQEFIEIMRGENAFWGI
jgi:translation initiation factor 5B